MRAKVIDGKLVVTLTAKEQARLGYTAGRLAPAPAAPVNTFHRSVIAARIPCAYGSASCASKRFAPNGVGSKQHTTCKRGIAAMKAARN